MSEIQIEEYIVATSVKNPKRVERREELKMIAKPVGRPDDAEAVFSSNYGQSTALVIFNDVFIPWEKVFLCGEWEYTSDSQKHLQIIIVNPVLELVQDLGI